MNDAKLTKTERDSIEEASDGYHLTSTITLSADLGASSVAGACWGK